MTFTRVTLSVVVPVYNEGVVLPAFYRRLAAVLADMDVSSEIVFVDDGSTDGTPALLIALREADSRIGALTLSRNFGKEIALSAGLDHATGDAVVIIDADLQDPPELIPRLVERWREGYDNVYAQRLSRAGDTALKRATAHAFYRILNRMSAQGIPPDTGDFRLLSRRTVDTLMQLRERHRFMKGLYGWPGYRHCAVPYERAPRHAGATKWNYWTLWNLSLEGITSFSTLPLRAVSYFGLLTSLGAIIYAVFIIIRTILFNNAVAGYPSLVVIMLFLGGVQLLSIGIIGEYLGRIFNEVKARPLYIIDRYEKPSTQLNRITTLQLKS